MKLEKNDKTSSKIILKKLFVIASKQQLIIKKIANSSVEEHLIGIKELINNLYYLIDMRVSNWKHGNQLKKIMKDFENFDQEEIPIVEENNIKLLFWFNKVDKLISAVKDYFILDYEKEDSLKEPVNEILGYVQTVKEILKIN